VTLTATQGLCCHAGSLNSWQSSGQCDFGSHSITLQFQIF
jgi:hypothetical protein